RWGNELPDQARDSAALFRQQVDVLIPFSTEMDKSTVTKQGKVMTDCGLALTASPAELANAEIAIGKRAKNKKTGWVAHHFEESGSGLHCLRPVSHLATVLTLRSRLHSGLCVLRFDGSHQS
ncbi:MAG TPA: hypothetical protein VKF17_19925, partial [Isosphaeraceae bacterium]|nr:hypothetical protein [Isosphaeraceae bacterium]